MTYLYKIKDLCYRHLRIGLSALLCIVSLLFQSCFENNGEFFINFKNQNNIPMNIVLPLVYEGTLPIKVEELHNEEKYSLLGNCKLSSAQNESPSQKSKDKTANDDTKEEPNLSNKPTGTPIPFFIIPTEGYEKIAGNKVRQFVYIMPEVLGPGEHYCLTVHPMYKEKKDLSEITQPFTFEFNTVGKKTSPSNEYSGPKYSDPDFFELGFPMPYKNNEQSDYLLPIHYQASQTFSPLFKFAKQGIPDDAFWANPRKIRDSIHVCEILKTPEISDSETNESNNDTQSSRINKKTECQPVNGIQIKMLEDLPASEDGQYVLTNYAYFTISGGALKLNTPYQIQVLYSFGDSKEDISLNNEIHSFMLVDDNEIISALTPEMLSKDNETETPDSEPEKKIDPAAENISSEEDDTQKTPQLNAKDLFDKFKHAHGQEPGSSYIEIPIRSLSNSTTNK